MTKHENLSDWEVRDIKRKLFYSTRDYLDPYVFAKVSPLLHIFINKLLINLSSTSPLYQFLKHRHNLITEKANMFKDCDEHKDKTDFDIWLLAEKHFME